MAPRDLAILEHEIGVRVSTDHHRAVEHHLAAPVWPFDDLECEPCYRASI
jgi:hypothetical protein